MRISVSDFDDLSPYELDLALKEHAETAQHIYEGLYLHRYIGAVLRNKGLKESHQIRDPRRFYTFPWEQQKKVKILTSQEWQELDKKYNR